MSVVEARFFNNRFGSLTVASPGRGFGAAAAVSSGSAVINCSFDSDPKHFKLDPRETTCCLGNTTVSYTHLTLGGWAYGAMVIGGNAFGAALVPVYAQDKDGASGGLTVGPGNTFTEFGLTACHIGALRGPLTVTSNTLSFAPLYQWPDAVVEANFRRYFPGLPAARALERHGVYVAATASTVPIVVADNAFEQEDPLPDHDLGYAHPQHGLVVEALRGPYQVARNHFANLSHPLGLGLYHDGSDSEVGGNTFVNCTANISLFNAGLSSSNAPVFWPRCNSFARGGSAAGETSGIRIEPGTRVVLDSYEQRIVRQQPYTEPMKNFFAGAAPGTSRFWWINNQSGTPLAYLTYEGNPLNIAVNINKWSDVEANSRNIISPLNRTRPNFIASDSCGAADSYPGTGINPSRASSMGGTSLGTSSQEADSPLTLVPNPAGASVLVTVRLHTGTSTTILYLADVLGRVVRQQAIALDAYTTELFVDDLPNGVYSCALMINGTRIQVRKLLIQH